MAFEKQLQIYVAEVTYRSPDGRFSVLRTQDLQQPKREITVVGDLSDVAPGETLRLHGEFREHRTYGERFHVSSWAPVTPETEAGIARYLGSGLIPGVGPALAARIVERFGAESLTIITTQSARLKEVSGVGKRRAERIAEAVRTRKEEADILSFLHSLGLGPVLARRLHKRYGAQTVAVIREDPYLVAQHVAGVGFRTADQIGLALGYEHNDPRRVAGAILHVLGKGADDGHTYLSQAQLLTYLRALQVPADRVDVSLKELSHAQLVVVESDQVYATSLYYAEVHVAQLLLSLRRPTPRSAEETALIDELINELRSRFAAAQLQAVEASVTHGLLVLTGGPGTGKTTTVQAIVEAHKALQHQIRLCSPTGRAAKRLTEATGHEALTIHRLLEYNPLTGEFGRNEETPLEANFVLVDEASMLDVQLAERLLCALPTDATLVLVGDVDQLPPVSPGPVLRELIASGACPVVRLTQVFRQAQRSAIVRSAHAILQGQRPVVTHSDERDQGDMYIVRGRQPEHILNLLQESLQRLRSRYDLDPIRDVQVLAPMRKGPLGTERLNQALQAALNPPNHGGGDVPAHFRPGDKVMQLRNDYQREVFNGDVGEVRRVDAGVVFVDMGGRQVAYEREAQQHITLAYASTIHKVQGSEFPAAVIVLHGSHRVLLTRALIYTAITRAKRVALIIGNEQALDQAIQHVPETLTNASLMQRLQG